jgi:mycothiol system anti-sigma-R factor
MAQSADGDNGPSEGGSECSQVLNDVWLFLDNEMDPDARAAVQRHIDDCSPCLEEAGIEEKLKKLIHRTCRGERAPEQLRMRLVSAIESISVTSTTVGPGGALRIEQTRVIRTAVDPGPAASSGVGRIGPDTDQVPDADQVPNIDQVPITYQVPNTDQVQGPEQHSR